MPSCRKIVVEIMTNKACVILNRRPDFVWSNQYQKSMQKTISRRKKWNVLAKCSFLKELQHDQILEKNSFLKINFSTYCTEMIQSKKEGERSNCSCPLTVIIVTLAQFMVHIRVHDTDVDGAKTCQRHAPPVVAYKDN